MPTRVPTGLILGQKPVFRGQIASVLIPQGILARKVTSMNPSPPPRISLSHRRPVPLWLNYGGYHDVVTLAHASIYEADDALVHFEADEKTLAR